MNKPSKLQQAVDYYYLHPGCSKNSAAVRCGVAGPNLHLALQKHASDVGVYESVGKNALIAVDAWFTRNPGSTLTTAAKVFNIPVSVLRAAYRGQDFSMRLFRIQNGQVVHTPDWHGGYDAGLEQAAKIAEMVGGEHGAAVATAIRAGV